MKKLWLIPTFAILAIGCNNATTAKTEDPKETVPSVTSKGPEATPAVDPASVPAELKHEGYEYYGLGAEKPINMEIVSSAGNAIQTGEQSVKLKSVEGGKAIYEITRTGQLGQQLGNMEVRVEKDAIYVHSSPIATVGEKDIELPASLAPGSTWKTRTIVKQDGQTMDVTNDFKVEGVEKLKTKVGEYDALLVTSKGSGTVQGQKLRMETQSWHVKGRGNIKTIMKTFDATNRANTITIQETK